MCGPAPLFIRKVISFSVNKFDLLCLRASIPLLHLPFRAAGNSRSPSAHTEIPNHFTSLLVPETFHDNEMWRVVIFFACGSMFRQRDVRLQVCTDKKGI